jgi:hypothetical protein
MSTKRRPLSRDRQPLFPPRAVELFRAMVELEEADEDYGCPPTDEVLREKWWDLHSELRKVLATKPWCFPCVMHPDVEMPGEFVDEAKQRYLALCEAAGIELEC